MALAIAMWRLFLVEQKGSSLSVGILSMVLSDTCVYNLSLSEGKSSCTLTGRRDYAAVLDQFKKMFQLAT